MSYIEESWKPEAERLGYKHEREMLKGLYDDLGYSLDEIARILEKKKNNIRRRMLAHGVRLRPRGGANHNKSKLFGASHAELYDEDPAVLAMKYGCCEATVYLERKFRQAVERGAL